MASQPTLVFIIFYGSSFQSFRIQFRISIFIPLSSRFFQLAWIAPLGISSPTSRPVAEILTEAAITGDHSDDGSRGAFQKCVRCHLRPKRSPSPRFFLYQKSSKSHQKVIKKSSKSHRKVIEKSSKSHRKVIKKSSKSHQKVIEKSSKSHQKVIEKSSKSHRKSYQGRS